MKSRLSPAAMISATALLLIAFAFSPSCGSLRFKKINPYNDFTSDHLHERDVKKIRIIIPDSISIYPGSTFPIGVIAVTSGRKELKTRGIANGFVNWNSYAVRVEGGSFDKEKGTVSVNYDPRTIANHFKIIVTPYYFPELKQEIEIPVSYKTKFVAYCKGQNGSGGFNGLSGEELHNLDENSYGFDGYNGQRGTDGETAADGCMADVFVKAITVDNKKLMSVLVINRCDNAHSVYWIDPDGGSLLLDVSGGNGGDGGHGGNGEHGENGVAPNLPQILQPVIITIYTNPPKYIYAYTDNADYISYPTNMNGGNGGIGGNGGNAGYGGNGGVAVIHLDSSAVQWKNKILVENSGGQAGKPGNGGYAGLGGRGVMIEGVRIDGRTGYIGAPGIKAKNGKPGGETEWRIEKVKMKW
jgi:hypothetical protein